MALAYVLWQPTAFFQSLRNGGYVSVGSWANPLYRLLDVFMTGSHAKIVVGVISYIGLIVIGWMLSRVVPWTPAPGLDKDADLQRDPLTIALRTALVLSVAWLITSMYTLSWYDLLAWMPLAVLAASKLDKIMVIRGAALSLAYVPGRAIDMGPTLDFTATRMRDTVSPIIQMAMVLCGDLVVAATRSRRTLPLQEGQVPTDRNRAEAPCVQAATIEGSTAPKLVAEGGAYSHGNTGQGAGIAA